MRGLQVHGLACPWNVYNSYRELMKPGAFKRFIASLHGEPLKMKMKHRRSAGYWTNLMEGSDGLFCSGVITDPAVAEIFERGDLPELSIAWRFADEKIDRGDVRATRLRFNSHHPVEQILFEMVGAQIVDHSEIDEASLGEISIVDEGAFGGTWVRRSA